MALEQLGGSGGFTYTQSSTPNNPEVGETWFDTSTDGGTGKIYADLGGGAQWHVLPVQDELQSGRTRELLLLLHDKPVPEVVDPLNLQTGLSETYTQSGSDYSIGNVVGTTATRTSDNSSFSSETGGYGLEVVPQKDINGVEVTISSNTSGVSSVILTDSNENILAEKTGSYSSGDIVRLVEPMASGTAYYVGAYNDGNQYTRGYYDGGLFPHTSNDIDITDGARFIHPDDSNSLSTFSQEFCFIDVSSVVGGLDGYVTDQFSAPTTAPADFQQWNAIRAEDVTTGGSTSAEPVEFEILDLSDTVLTSSRIPKSELADEKFRFRDREYSEDAGSNGQSDYTIPETGDGGHFGLPILTVVSVKQNGSVLDSDNWSFDSNTDTVTIDTANVSIASGDTIEIKYDFDVFDSTLRPRAYLFRESRDETSPSISHFRYEYIV
jgi:hypothetical protein